MTKSERAEYMQEWRKSNPERWRKISAKSRKKRSADGRVKNEVLRWKYGIGYPEFRRMITEQDNRCAICMRPFKSERVTFVDHDHNTGKVRGILCAGCNMGIGILGEDVKILQKAINYLQTESVVV
jgi:hypothetical protein